MYLAPHVHLLVQILYVQGDEIPKIPPWKHIFETEKIKKENEIYHSLNCNSYITIDIYELVDFSYIQYCKTHFYYAFG